MKGNEIIKDIIREEMPDIEKVRQICLSQKNNIKRPHKKAIIIIAVTALLFALSANIFLERIIEPYVQPYGEIIENLKFKGFDVNKVNEIILSQAGSGDGYTSVFWWVDNKSGEVINYGKTWWQYGSIAEWADVKTLGEAEKHLVFTPAELNYLPEGCIREKILLRQYPQGNYDIHNLLINYTIYRDDGNPDRTFNLFAQYVGEKATVKMNTTNDIEKVILNNNIEALLLTEIAMPYDVVMTYHRIMWIKDGVLYETSGDERDEIIKMAESVK